MPRDIPQGKKMPSLVVAIGDKGPKGPPMGAGRTDPAPDAGPSDDSPESKFTCPECGASLKCESAGESSMESEPDPGVMGA